MTGNPNHDERGRFAAGDRVSFQSSGAQRGTGSGGHANRLTPEEEAAARARSAEYQARLKERMAARTVEPKPVPAPGGERVGFRSLGTTKGVFDMGKRIMREFALFEISAVDRPCQEGARMAIVKRAPLAVCPECGGKNGAHDPACSLHKAAKHDDEAADRKLFDQMMAERERKARKAAMDGVCKECGGTNNGHMEKCSMFGKASPWWPEFVDNPYAVGGDVLEYCKRTFTQAQRDEAERKGQAMPGGGFPVENESDLKNAIRAIGRAKNPAAARAHIKTRAKALGLSDLIPDTWKNADASFAGALESFQPILATAAAHDAPAWRLAPVYAAIVKAAPDIDALPEGERGETLDGLLAKCVEHLAKIVPEGKVDAFKAAVAAKGEGPMDPKELEKLQKRVAVLELLAKATDSTKAFMAAQKMDEAAQTAFLTKSANEQKAEIAKAKKPPKDDDGDDKEPDDDADDMKKALKKRDSVIEELTKTVDVLKAKDELTVCKELCRAAGISEGYASRLVKLRKLDPAEAEAALKDWAAAAKQANPDLFREIGKGGTGGDFATPYDELCAKAQELLGEMKKADPKTKMTIEKAKAEIYTDVRFGDLAKRLKRDEAQRRMGRAAA